MMEEIAKVCQPLFQERVQEHIQENSRSRLWTCPMHGCAKILSR